MRNFSFLLVGCLCLCMGCRERNGTVNLGGSAEHTRRSLMGSWGEGTEVYREIRFSPDGTAMVAFNGLQGAFEVPAEYECPDFGLVKLRYRANEQQRRMYAEAVRALPNADARNAGREVNPPWVYQLADLPGELPEVAQYEIALSGQKHHNLRLRICTNDAPATRQELFSLKALQSP